MVVSSNAKTVSSLSHRCRTPSKCPSRIASGFTATFRKAIPASSSALPLKALAKLSSGVSMNLSARPRSLHDRWSLNHKPPYSRTEFAHEIALFPQNRIFGMAR